MSDVATPQEVVAALADMADALDALHPTQRLAALGALALAELKKTPRQEALNWIDVLFAAL